jgi:hypothetical protein
MSGNRTSRPYAAVARATKRRIGYSVSSRSSMAIYHVSRGYHASSLSIATALSGKGAGNVPNGRRPACASPLGTEPSRRMAHGQLSGGRGEVESDRAHLGVGLSLLGPSTMVDPGRTILTDCTKAPPGSIATRVLTSTCFHSPARPAASAPPATAISPGAKMDAIRRTCRGSHESSRHGGAFGVATASPRRVELASCSTGLGRQTQRTVLGPLASFRLRRLKVNSYPMSHPR